MALRANESSGQAFPASATRAAAGFVRVRGAREHNLRDVTLEIPRNALVVARISRAFLARGRDCPRLYFLRSALAVSLLS